MIHLQSGGVFEEIAASTIGLRTSYPIQDAAVVLDALPEHLIPPQFDGESTTLPLTYLDSAASTKMIGPVADTQRRILEHYANSHSVTHGPARIATHYYDESHEVVRRFVNAPETHTAVFVGSGATGAVNRLARTLFSSGSRDSRDTVIFSGMEHHANQLPWQKHARRTVGIPVDPDTGTLPLDRFAETLKKNRNRTRLVAVTGVSNVTGIINDIREIARMAHEIGAQILVDAAQTAAHRKIDMQADGVDYLVLSGHKVYAPSSPGVLVMPKSASPHVPDEVGGGIVLSVDLDRYLLSDRLPAREEAGTPNIVGSILLASAIKTLEGIGMDRVWEHERRLTAQLVEGLSVFEEIKIYGDTDLSRTPRAGVVSFSVADLHHAVVAQALSDYFSIAVRNECFCAHPYVKALTKMTPNQIEDFELSLQMGDRRDMPGMVRASLGVYTLPEDVERLHAAIDWVTQNLDRLRGEYEVDYEGVAVRRDGWRIDPRGFGIF